MWSQLTPVEIEYLRTGALGKKHQNCDRRFHDCDLSQKG
jgi:hypothetical protein